MTGAVELRDIIEKHLNVFLRGRNESRGASTSGERTLAKRNFVGRSWPKTLDQFHVSRRMEEPIQGDEFSADKCANPFIDNAAEK